MQKLNLDFGTIRLAINDDPERVITFNPKDIGLIERFYTLVGELQTKGQEHQAKQKNRENAGQADEYGLPADLSASLREMKELCGYLREQIDLVFGEGTSQKVFGDLNTLDMFEQFFAGIAPFILEARENEINKYIASGDQGVMS